MAMPAASLAYRAPMPAGSTFPRSLEIELGTPGLAPNQVTGYSWIDQWEDVPELRWPAAGRVYDRMWKDSKVRGSAQALLRPILAKSNFHLGTKGADPRVVAFIETELGLRQLDQAVARRRTTGIVFRQYAREALAARARFGHAVFEQVYEIGGPTAEQGAAGLTGVFAHLHKLAPRPARTLGDPVVAIDGGLEGWKQIVSKPGRPFEEVLLPIDRLVVHVFEKEGADWYGQSLLRPAWKHWAIRDVLMRVGAMAVERNGLGIAVVGFDPQINGATEARALQLARAIRAGDDAGVALPEGYSLNLVGVTGQVRNELPLLEYHGQLIGHAMSTMVMDLGHDAGARSLGDTFLDLLTGGQNAIADDFCEEVTEYVIRDLVTLNFGEDEPVPPLLHDTIEAASITWDDISNFAKAGLIIPDDRLEAELRRIRGLPLWPGATSDDPDLTVADVIELDPSAPPSVPTPPALPAPVPVAASGRSLAELEARVATVQAGVEARRATGRR